MVIAGIFVDSRQLVPLTRAWIELKRQHFPGRFAGVRSLDAILVEVKGSEIQALTRKSGRNDQRKASRFRKELVDLLAHHEVRIMARVWVKSQGTALTMKSSYGYAVQDIAQAFNHFVSNKGVSGVVIADSRDHRLNGEVAHSVFTQKWRAGGDPLARIVEVPVFAASDNHAGLQLADMVASTLVFPIAVAAFCERREGYVHRPDRYEAIRLEFGPALKKLRYRAKDATGRWRGGYIVTGIAPGSLSRFFGG